MRRIAVLVQVVVVILFRRHASNKFQGAISWTITWIFLLNCLSLKYVLSDHFRWSNVPVHQNKLKMCLHFDQIRTWHRCLKLAFFGPVTKRVEEWVHKAIAKHAGIVWLDKNEDLTLKMAVLSSQTIPACFAIALWTHSSTRFVVSVQFGSEMWNKLNVFFSRCRPRVKVVSAWLGLKDWD